jgi:hypothetical protein
MPPPPIVIGLEREWASVSNGDTGKVTLFYTIQDAQEHFTARVVQEGSGTAILRIYNADGTSVLREWLIAPGSRALITLQDSVTINVPFSQVRTRVTLQGAPAQGIAGPGKGNK